MLLSVFRKLLISRDFLWFFRITNFLKNFLSPKLHSFFIFLHTFYILHSFFRYFIPLIFHAFPYYILFTTISVCLKWNLKSFFINYVDFTLILHAHLLFTFIFHTFYIHLHTIISYRVKFVTLDLYSWLLTELYIVHWMDKVCGRHKLGAPIITYNTSLRKLK